MNEPMRRAILVRVNVAKQDDGVYVATSDELPEIVLAHNSLDFIRDEIPGVIRDIVLARYGFEPLVMEIDSPESRNLAIPHWAAIPPSAVENARR
ncbi:MAG: hypothetical protein FJX46_11185 [Alphaproteobacteria bacterium]|nr:hypothetical protein [Alphaproteobacteria bacterium]